MLVLFVAVVVVHSITTIMSIETRVVVDGDSDCDDVIALRFDRVTNHDCN